MKIRSLMLKIIEILVDRIVRFAEKNMGNCSNFSAFQNETKYLKEIKKQGGKNKKEF